MAEELARTLRTQALMRRLVAHTTGLPASSPQLELGLDYAHVHLKHHRFSDADAEGDAVFRKFAALRERLVQHSEHAKARALEALTERLCEVCGEPPRQRWRWRSAHAAVGEGVAALAALYWLSDAAEMLRSPMAWGEGLPASLTRVPAYELERRAWSGASVEWEDDFLQAEAVAEAFADECEEEEWEEEEEVEEEQREEGQATREVHEEDSERQARGERGATRSAGNDWRRGSTLPPAGLDCSLIGAGLRRLRAARGRPASLRQGAPRSEELELWAEQRLLQLRLYREALRALSAIGGSEIAFSGCREVHVPSPLGEPRRLRLLGCHLTPRGEATLASPLLPSGQRQLMARLTLSFGRVAAIEAFARELMSSAAAGCTLCGVAEGMLGEVAALRREAWRADERARHAQQQASGGCLPSPRDGTHGSLLLLERRLHARGWHLALAELESVRLALERHSPRGAYAPTAAALAIDLLLRRYASRQLLSSAAPRVARARLRLASAAVRPYLRQLELWLREGRSPTLRADVKAAARVAAGGEEAWRDGAAVAEEGLPRAIAPLAREMARAARARQLLAALPPADEAAAAAAAEVGSLEAAFCRALLRLLRPNVEEEGGRGGRGEEGGGDGEEGHGERGKLHREGGVDSRSPPEEQSDHPAAGRWAAAFAEGKELPRDVSMKACAPLEQLMRRAPLDAPSGENEAQRSLCDLRAVRELRLASPLYSFHPLQPLPSFTPSTSPLLPFCPSTPSPLSQHPSRDWEAIEGLRRALQDDDGYELDALPSSNAKASSHSSTTCPAALPPFRLVIEQCLLAPIQQLCRPAGPQLLSALSRLVQPRRAVELLFKVMLFGDPSLAGVTCEALFSRLEVHGSWRRQLPQLCIMLHNRLVEGGLTQEEAALFSFQIETEADIAAAPDAAAASPPAGLDSHDVRALDSLRVHFHVRWPLHLTLSAAARRRHEQVFSLLLQLRRAKWSLETAGGDGRGAAAWRHEHAWRVLRAELLHFVNSFYNHLALAVIQVEWVDFHSRLDSLSDVDAFRELHDRFAERIHSRCLLTAQFATLLDAVRSILNLTVRLKGQLFALSSASRRPPHSVAEGWRAELNQGVQSVLSMLREEAGRNPQASGWLVDLRRCLDFNRFYGTIG
ncbi:hypothetical protein AB1Y20_013151 [Prymnesium parvum]|uniref:Gamma tubulin complex component C-terminal domain-containing protein n=1 Tax=Prymnesium parvum TaxID=97485 RepID=A0AB34IJS9_PRYPA